MSSPKEFKGQLLRLREARRLADRDAQLLANRIALLEAEEAKAWKKIKQTKERAENILTLRQEHQEERQEVRRQVRLNRQSTRHNSNNSHARNKKSNQVYVGREVDRSLHSKRHQKEQNKARKAAHDMKAAQARLAKDRRQQADAILRKNKARRDKIYSSREKARGRREKKKQDVLERNKTAYTEKVGEETTKRVKTEARVSLFVVVWRGFFLGLFLGCISTEQLTLSSSLITHNTQHTSQNPTHASGIENGSD
jgi:hypothetical protein